jgi:hypothetical protein
VSFAAATPTEVTCARSESGSESALARLGVPQYYALDGARRVRRRSIRRFQLERNAVMRFTIVILAVLMVGMSGCRKKKEAFAEKMMERALKTASGNKADVDISGGKVQIKTEEGNVTISGKGDLALPDTLPEDVPIYKNAGVMQTVDQGDQGLFLMLTTPDSVDQVAEFYRTAIAEKGWTSESAMDMPGNKMLTCSKGKLALHVMITGGEEGKTMISLTCQPAN